MTETTIASGHNAIPSSEGCQYSSSGSSADAVVAVALYPAAYYDQFPETVAASKQDVPGHRDTYFAAKQVIMKWGGRTISVQDLSLSSQGPGLDPELMAKLGEVLRG